MAPGAADGDGDGDGVAELFSSRTAAALDPVASGEGVFVGGAFESGVADGLAAEPDSVGEGDWACVVSVGPLVLVGLVPGVLVGPGEVVPLGFVLRGRFVDDVDGADGEAGPGPEDVGAAVGVAVGEGGATSWAAGACPGSRRVPLCHASPM